MQHTTAATMTITIKKRLKVIDHRVTSKNGAWNGLNENEIVFVNYYVL